jgi:hypothetical protein
VWGIGGTTAGTVLRLLAPSTTQLNLGINGSNRVFTASLLTSGTQKLLGILAAGAGIGTGVLYQNGTLLSQASTSNPSNTLSLGTGLTTLGTEPSLAISYHDGKAGEFIVWNSVLSAGDITAVNAL